MAIQQKSNRVIKLKTAPRFLCLFRIMATVLAVAAPSRAVNDSLYFLFQRSTYLENLSMPGAWWANPAKIAEIREKTALTVNVSPLGNVYTIASARYVSPLGGRFGWGIGILGAGINHNPDPSLQAANGSAQYRSRFTFSNPSIQIGAAAKAMNGLCIGLLSDFGAELHSDGYGDQSNYPTAGIGVGLLTPYFGNRLSLSFFYMSTGHFWQQTYWDHDGKAAIRFMASDSSVTGSIEYSFSISSGAIGHVYNVVKGLASIKILSIAGVMLGFSDDLDIFSDNGAMAHIGIELQRSSVYPFFGGYEIGIAVTHSHRDLFVHRLWVGYCFR